MPIFDFWADRLELELDREPYGVEEDAEFRGSKIGPVACCISIMLQSLQWQPVGSDDFRGPYDAKQRSPICKVHVRAVRPGIVEWAGLNHRCSIGRDPRIRDGEVATLDVFFLFPPLPMFPFLF